jgi:hypothetical protein
MWIYTSTPPYAFMAYCLLIKGRDSFTSIVSYLRLVRGGVLLPSGFPAKTTFAILILSMRATRLILLDVITLIILNFTHITQTCAGECACDVAKSSDTPTLCSTAATDRYVEAVLHFPWSLLYLNSAAWAGGEWERRFTPRGPGSIIVMLWNCWPELYGRASADGGSSTIKGEAQRVHCCQAHGHTVTSAQRSLGKALSPSPQKRVTGHYPEAFKYSSHHY